MARPIETAAPDVRGGRLTRLAARTFDLVRPAMFAASAGLAIAGLAFFGVLQRTAYPSWQLANLDAEASVGTTVSATLLWIAAVAWLLVGVLVRPHRAVVWTWAGTLVFIALDEGVAIHEKLERWSGIDWQALYVPVMAAGAVAVWRVIRFDLRSPSSRLLIATFAAWAVVLALELIQNWGGEPLGASLYDPTMIIEEVLEMVGAAAAAVAALTSSMLSPEVGGSPSR